MIIADWSLKSHMPASEPFISKETTEYTSNFEFLLKIYHFALFFFLEVAFIDKTYQTLSAVSSVTTSDRG